MRVVPLVEVVADVTSGDWGQGVPASNTEECVVIRATDFESLAKADLVSSPRRFLRSASLAKRQLLADDLLVEMSGGSEAQPTGRIAFVSATIAESPLPVSFSNFVKRIRVTSEVDAEYFALAWRNLYYRGKTRPYEKRTTGIRNFKLGDFLASEHLPLPSLEDQRRIVRAMATIARARASSHSVLRICADLAESIRNSFSPAMSSWPLVSLGSVATVRSGATPPTAVGEYWMGDIPFVRTTEIDGGDISDCEGRVSQQAITDRKTRLFPSGSIFMAMYGQGKTRGNVAFLEMAAATSQNTAVIDCDPERLDSRYLFFYLKGQYDNLRRDGIQGQISHLNVGYVKRLEVPCPRLHEQREFAHAVSAINRKQSVETLWGCALDSLFSSTLHSLLDWTGTPL